MLTLTFLFIKQGRHTNDVKREKEKTNEALQMFSQMATLTSSHLEMLHYTSTTAFRKDPRLSTPMNIARMTFEQDEEGYC
jgi:hypothetical protein